MALAHQSCALADRFCFSQHNTSLLPLSLYESAAVDDRACCCPGGLRTLHQAAPQHQQRPTPVPAKGPAQPAARTAVAVASQAAQMSWRSKWSLTGVCSTWSGACAARTPRYVSNVLTHHRTPIKHTEAVPLKQLRHLQNCSAAGCSSHDRPCWNPTQTTASDAASAGVSPGARIRLCCGVRGVCAGGRSITLA